MTNKILALDCAHETCSVAVTAGNDVIAFQTAEMERGQAEALIPMVQSVMKRANVDFSDLSCIAVSTGPGSFTGVRVGLAAADGLAMAANLPEIGVSLLEAVAFSADFAGKLCVVLETKRDDFYAQLFDNKQPVSDPFVAEGAYFDTLQGFAFAGNGVQRLIEETGKKNVAEVPMPDAVVLGKMAAGKTPERKTPAPLYLREAEVTLCRK